MSSCYDCPHDPLSLRKCVDLLAFQGLTLVSPIVLLLFFPITQATKLAFALESEQVQKAIKVARWVLALA